MSAGREEEDEAEEEDDDDDDEADENVGSMVLPPPRPVGEIRSLFSCELANRSYYVLAYGSASTSTTRVPVACQSLGQSTY